MSSFLPIALSYAPYLIVLFIRPLIMLFIGRKLHVESEKLKYSRLLFLTLITSIALMAISYALVSFSGYLNLPALSIILSAVAICLLAYMIKIQLSASWGKALIMAIGGEIAGRLLLFAFSLIIAALVLGQGF